MNKEYNENLIAFHPGYYIKKYLSNQGMKQSELAERLNTSEKNISNLVNGKIGMDDKMAESLALVLGTSSTLWKNLNSKYLQAKDKINKDRQLKKEEIILKEMDYSFWSKNGFVKNTGDAAEKVSEMKRFLHISSLEVLQKRDFLVQYRTSVNEVKPKNVINSNAWVQTALNLGNQQQVKPINLKYLRSQLPVIKSMTIEEINDVQPRLKEIFNRSGVAFVSMPNLKNCGINGAVKWLGNDKVLLALSDRRKTADLFWFALFHEIRHVFQQKKGHIIVSSKRGLKLDSPLDMKALEQDADDFAQNYLISKNDYREFVSQNDFSRVSVEDFSRKIGIHCGILVGRLQRDRYVPFDHLNSCKQKYEAGFKDKNSAYQ